MLATGRIVFATAITGFGVLCLAYVDFVHALQPVPASLPGYGFLAVLTGLLLLVAGLAVMADVRTDAVGLALVALLTSWIVLLHIPSAFTDPALLRSPWWVRTFETSALAGAALILAGLASDPARGSWVRTGRVAFGVSLPVFGMLHFIYADNVASLVPPWYPWPLFWAYLTGAGHFAAGVAIAAGVLPRLAATLAGVMYGSWALTLHIPRVWCRAFGPCQFMDEAAALQSPRLGLTSMFVAVGMCGSAWIVAGSLARKGSNAPSYDHARPAPMDGRPPS
jgi:uncharacterized membrane protein YphA (DoxX/SURF4 family)